MSFTSRDALRVAAAVFDVTLEGVLVTNRDGFIVHVNRAFMDITGYAWDEVIGQRPSKFKSGRHDADFYQQVYAALNERGEWSGEIWNRRKNGEIYPQWQTIRAVHDDNNVLSHHVAVFSDISAIKRYALYTEELTAHAQHRVETAAELRRALQHDELRVFYQPVRDLPSNRTVGVEALVRWAHPQRGMVSPGEFIPIAERTGLIADIDTWVLRQACQQMVCWQGEGRGLEFVAVNLSSRSFGQRALFHQVAQVLQETGLDPALLELEVTESAVMEDPEVALEQLHRLRELGLRLAIDDFGTGYSSLLRLKRLPVQKLKIDQGFVAGLPHDEDDVAIVRVIIALARSMGMQVHAEGIEQAEQARLLLEQHCDLGQGYWFGRPVPAEQLRWD